MPRSVLRPHLKSAPNELADALAAITAKNGLSREFSPEVEAAAGLAAQKATLPTLDLLELAFITIDPPESTDLDQALHIEEHGDGFRVRYAIADVPSFVDPGGVIDAEARRRGQTIYAPDGRIPLHPTVLSEDAASLLPDQERGAFVWDFTLGADGAILSSSVQRARVKSRAKLSYEGVQADIDAGTADPMLLLLKRVGLLRIELEQARGGASLNIPDTEIEQDGDGYRLVRRSPLAVEDWNAQISLMTGMAAAELMLGAKIGILRTMPPPEQQAITEFRRKSVALGHPWGDDVAYGAYLRTLDTSDPKQLAIMYAAGSLFRGAGYTAFDGTVPAEPQQAAVAAPYAHATAPLRRLVDRFVLVICEAIAQDAEVPAWAREALPQLPELMSASGAIESTVSRAAIDTVEAAALSTRIGEIFDAVVISVNGGDKDAPAGKGKPAQKGTIQLRDPAVTASCTGALVAGEAVKARLSVASIAEAKIAFETI